MAQNPKPRSILDSLGEEIIRIITPVSICMFLVVLLVTILDTNSTSDSNSSLRTIATLVYDETSSDSTWDKIKGALLYSLVFVAVITVVTFILVLLFYCRCTKFLKIYMGFSAFVVLGFMGGEVAVFLLKDFSIPIDCITFCVLLFNFSVVGVISVFMSKMAILITQGYLVVIGMLVAYWFTQLPEWTTWALLVVMALYDLAAVLLPGGPLRLLVELAMSREEEIPALVYEARPVVTSPRRLAGRKLWKRRVEGDSNVAESSNANMNANSDSNSSSTLGDVVSIGGPQDERRVVHAEEGRISVVSSELTAPLIDQRNGPEENVQSETENWPIDSIGLGSSGAIKLGLGDFIFYSVLVGRAAMYDFMTVYACYLAIIAGLGITLMLLAFYQKALPALPVSILLGVLFYVLTRTLLEAFVVQCSINLLMF